MLSLVIFLIILSALVLIHELGHFVAAKKNGVKVEEFGLGLPPRIWSKKVGETEYSLNWLPFGGFVKLEGEDSLDMPEKSPESVMQKADSRNFMSKTPLQRTVILVAGVFMNVMLAFVLYYVLFLSNGFKTLNMPFLFDYQFKFGRLSTVNTVVMSFQDKSAARDAGVNAGESIAEVNGQPVYSIPEVRAAVADKAGKEVSLLLVDMKAQNKDAVRVVKVMPNADDAGKGILGVYMTKVAVLEYTRPWEKLLAGPLHSYNMLSYSGFVLSKLIGMSVETKSVTPVSESVSGPVGIYSVIGSILEYGGAKALLGIIDFCALMSLSLAFMNILPFPALDGGRVLFILIEVVRGGKRVSAALESSIHKWGMIALLSLIVLVTIKDIGRVFF